MSEPPLNSETTAELVTLLEQLKTHGQNWKAALEQGEEMLKRYQMLKEKAKAS